MCSGGTSWNEEGCDRCRRGRTGRFDPWDMIADFESECQSVRQRVGSGWVGLVLG